MSDRNMDIIKDYNNERLVFHKQQDCGEILKANRAEQNTAIGSNDLGFGRKYASVPIDVLDAWILHEGIDYRLIGKDPAMKKRFFEKLNSRDWCGFKTHTGNL